ncbi:hypothetical protein BGW38_004161 [Lunasporangiospora selenospora]|uniref:DUF6589 domain-containing protein n=1 Tax=Lunasporangiospora selenospora TaxID=979761 RepID=A0A9P6KCC3_9FUNG|nr:hypothetical protein BGW38_004161 [Lunasporangiospora selenospora]
MLTQDTRKRIQSLAKTVPWYIVYDNINIGTHRHHQRIGNRDVFISGTTASIVLGSSEAFEELPTNCARNLCVADLLPTKSCERHLRAFCKYHLVDVLRRNFDEFANLSVPLPTKNRLPVKKTVISSLPTMRIDESTVHGNREVLESIVSAALDLPEVWFEGRRILVAGDQMSVARLRRLIELRWDDISTFQRFDWVIPVLQLFHLQMLLASTILRTHYGDSSSPGSMSFYAHLLGRKRVNFDKADFHSLDELLRHVFDAMAIKAWEVVLDTSDLHEYAREFSEGGRVFDVDVKADELIDKFLNAAASDDLNGTASRNSALFMRDAIIFIELSSAIKDGDVGRVEKVLRWITIMFQAGSTRNYANELLHLFCGFEYKWTHETKEAIRSSWLVNIKGQEGRWIPADLQQEHHNFTIKNMFKARGVGNQWNGSEETISMNIQNLERVSHQLESVLDVPYSGTKHAKLSAATDIQTVYHSLVEYDIFGTEPQDNHPNLTATIPAKNLFEDGIIKLTESNRVMMFLESLGTQATANDDDLEMEVDDDMESDRDDDIVDFGVEEHLENMMRG